MKRRKFLTALGAAAATTTVAKPVIAQSNPTIKWRLAASWPKSLDTIYGACETIPKYISEATDGKFQIQSFAAGEIVPALQVLDAVQNGTVEMGHTAMYYFIGKDPTWALFCATPFGLNARQQNAWYHDGEGTKLIDDFGKKFNVHCLSAGNTGCQMGGWFNKELKEPADLKGLKMRIGGWAGKTLGKLGVVAQQIAGGDIYPALEKGTIDAAEWVGPYDDEKLGFYKVVKFYYYPGWWEGGTTLHQLVNLAKWNELPKSYQAIVTAAAAYANTEVQARYDARNPQALKRLVAAGTQLRPFSQSILEACLKASNEVNAETGDLVLYCLGDKELSGNVINTRLAVRKNRGGQQGREYPFTLRMVQAPEPDEDGVSISTMVVDWVPVPPGGGAAGTGPMGASSAPRSAYCGAAAEAGADGRPG